MSGPKANAEPFLQKRAYCHSQTKNELVQPPTETLMFPPLVLLCCRCLLGLFFQCTTNSIEFQEQIYQTTFYTIWVLFFIKLWQIYQMEVVQAISRFFQRIQDAKLFLLQKVRFVRNSVGTFTTFFYRETSPLHFTEILRYFVCRKSKSNESG